MEDISTLKDRMTEAQEKYELCKKEYDAAVLRSRTDLSQKYNGKFFKKAGAVSTTYIHIEEAHSIMGEFLSYKGTVLSDSLTMMTSSVNYSYGEQSIGLDGLENQCKEISKEDFCRALERLMRIYNREVKVFLAE